MMPNTYIKSTRKKKKKKEKKKLKQKKTEKKNKMKLLRKQLEKDGSGTIRLCAEEPDDMWHAYNIVTPGDFLEATTVRRVQREGATGTTESMRVRVKLELAVVSVDFDTSAGVLHVNGRNHSENKHVKKGAFHTIDLVHGTPFSVTKSNWDSIYLSRIDVACDPVNYADVAVIVLQEGLAHLCLLTPSMTITKAKIEVSIPRKRRGHNSGRDKAITQFHAALVEAVQLHVNFDVVKAVLVASPAFYKDEFAAFMWKEAHRRELRDLIANRSKFILCHASTGHRHAVAEVLSDPVNLERLGDTKASLETRRLQEFYNMISSDPDRALYGYAHVKLAAERCV
jgi:protein pelota